MLYLQQHLLYNNNDNLKFLFILLVTKKKCLRFDLKVFNIFLIFITTFVFFLFTYFDSKIILQAIFSLNSTLTQLEKNQDLNKRATKIITKLYNSLKLSDIDLKANSQSLVSSL